MLLLVVCLFVVSFPPGAWDRLHHLVGLSNYDGVMPLVTGKSLLQHLLMEH